MTFADGAEQGGCTLKTDVTTAATSQRCQNGSSPLELSQNIMLAALEGSLDLSARIGAAKKVI